MAQANTPLTESTTNTDNVLPQPHDVAKVLSEDYVVSLSEGYYYSTLRPNLRFPLLDAHPELTKNAMTDTSASKATSSRGSNPGVVKTDYYRSFEFGMMIAGRGYYNDSALLSRFHQPIPSRREPPEDQLPLDSLD